MHPSILQIALATALVPLAHAEIVTNVTATPEPCTLSLLGSGLLGLRPLRRPFRA